eukprot:6440266-Amphidinium_carterae.1
MLSDVVFVLQFCSGCVQQCLQLVSQANARAGRLWTPTLLCVTVTMAMTGCLYVLGCTCVGQVISAKVIAWVRSRIGGDRQRADDGAIHQTGQDGVSLTTPYGLARSGCLTLRQHTAAMCREWHKVRADKRRRRLSCKRASAIRAQQWRRVVATRRASNGIMLGQRVLADCDLGDDDTAACDEVVSPVECGVFDELPVRQMSVVNTIAQAHCTGDGNCMWRALAKALRNGRKRIPWQRIKRKVINYGRKTFGDRAGDMLAMSRWGVPGNAAMLQLAASRLQMNICLDWQNEGYVFGSASSSAPGSEIWLRLFDHHFEPALPLLGPVQHGGELGMGDLARCIGGYDGRRAKKMRVGKATLSEFLGGTECACDHGTEPACDRCLCEERVCGELFGETDRGRDGNCHLCEERVSKAMLSEFFGGTELACDCCLCEERVCGKAMLGESFGSTELECACCLWAECSGEQVSCLTTLGESFGSTELARDSYLCAECSSEQ